MQAMVHERYGAPDVVHLEDVPRPVPTDNEVLIRVRAAGVNWADWSISRGVPYMVRLGFGLRRPRQGVRGTDLSGVVAELGSGGGGGLGVGDEVFGWGKGTFAEYVSVPAGNLLRKAAEISFEQAAAVPMAGMTALQALRDVGNVQPGQRVLVVGASGGIGTFAVQIAKTMGAVVTGVCSTGNVSLVRSIGADHVIDYTKEDFTEGEPRYDFILDIADTHSLSERRRVLAPKGTLVPNSGEGGRVGGSLGRIVAARMMSPFVSHKLRPFLSLPKREDLVALQGMIEAGQVKPVVGKTFPLLETADALRYVGERHAGGKTVITI